MNTEIKTQRDCFADLIPTSGWGAGLVYSGLQDRALEGLEALAALYFAEFTDETELPPAFDQIKYLYECVSTGFLEDSDRFAAAYGNEDEEE